MGRPRLYDVDSLLEHARQLWIARGRSAVTMRALCEASGASNGAVYHAFGSRDGLLARVWAREADGFLAFQRALVDEEQDPADALVAAAIAPAAYALENEAGARILLSANADQLVTPELDDTARAELRRLQQDLGALLVELSTGLWDRRDRAAVTTVRYCVVDLPGALLLKGRDVTDPLARHALEQAVRGIASTEPPTKEKP